MKGINIVPEAATGVSVIICCYNSALRLPQTLQHLAAQEMPAACAWEIVLVNNASTDNTVALATAIWQQLGAKTSLRIIQEPRPGQMHARKTGAREAAFEYLVFCDDDNWLGPQYITAAREVMQNHSRVAIAGGRNYPVTDAAAYPDWFEEYKDKYATGVPAKTSGDITMRGFVLGAGMVTRRSVFLTVNDERYPSLLNGRNGEQLSTGDDFEYCKRVMLWDYQLYYDDRMVLEHFIPAERLTIPYRERLMEGILQAGVVINQYDLALRFYRKNRHKNRLRLLLLTPFRIFFSSRGWMNRDPQDERLCLYYLSPFSSPADRIKAGIKRFIYRK